MKEASWNDCMYSNSSVKITPDREKAKSLLETARERLKSSARKVTGKNANFVFEDYYSSILEMVHALLLLEGFKVNNHICLGFYLKDVLKEEELYRVFDDCRYKRNSLVYYGKRMDFETAKDAIKKSKRFIREFKKIIEKRKNKAI